MQAVRDGVTSVDQSPLKRSVFSAWLPRLLRQWATPGAHYIGAKTWSSTHCPRDDPTVVVANAKMSCGGQHGDISIEDVQTSTGSQLSPKNADEDLEVTLRYIHDLEQEIRVQSSSHLEFEPEWVCATHKNLLGGIFGFDEVDNLSSIQDFLVDPTNLPTGQLALGMSNEPNYKLQFFGELPFLHQQEQQDLVAQGQHKRPSFILEDSPPLEPRQTLRVCGTMTISNSEDHRETLSQQSEHLLDTITWIECEQAPFPMKCLRKVTSQYSQSQRSRARLPSYHVTGKRICRKFIF